MKYRCPCCGYYTFDERPNGKYDICPVCFWEDDPFQMESPDYREGANGISLNQARENYLQYGACILSMKMNVREPNEEELSGID